MKQRSNLLVYSLAILLVTALNIFSNLYLSEIIKNYFDEKIFNIVCLSISGLLAIVFLLLQNRATILQYEEAQIILNRRYSLRQLVWAPDGHELKVVGALLCFRRESGEKQYLFFKDIKFSPETNLHRDRRFIAVENNSNDIVLKPRRDYEKDVSLRSRHD